MFFERQSQNQANANNSILNVRHDKIILQYLQQTDLLIW